MRFINPLIALLFTTCFIGGCNQEPTPTPAPAPSQISKNWTSPADDLGRPVSLKKPAQRVVCVGPGATEVIFGIGESKKLVGRDQVSDYPPETSEIPVVGDYNGPFLEKTAALKPDLVIVQGETYDKTRAENWQKKIGVPVAVLVPTSFDKLADGIDKIGGWLGAEERARLFSASFRTPIPQTAPNAKLTVFFEIGRSPLWTAGKGTLIDSALQQAGLGNVAKDLQGYKQMNLESLATRQPDIYIVTAAEPDPQKTLDELQKHPVLGKLRCIQEKHVVVMPGDWILRPGPRLIEGIGILKHAAEKFKKIPTKN